MLILLDWWVEHRYRWACYALPVSINIITIILIINSHVTVVENEQRQRHYNVKQKNSVKN